MASDSMMYKNVRYGEWRGDPTKQAVPRWNKQYNKRVADLIDQFTEDHLSGDDLENAGRNELVLSHLKWAADCAASFVANGGNYRRVLYFDDAISACFYGLLIAAERYDPEKGAFTTYSKHWMYHHLIQMMCDTYPGIRPPYRYYRRDYKGPPITPSPLDSPITHQEDGESPNNLENNLTAAEVIPNGDLTQDEAKDQAYYRDAVKKIISEMDERHQVIIHGVFGFDESPSGEVMTQKEISKCLGVSVQRTNQLLKQALERFKWLWTKKYKMSTREAMECLQNYSSTEH